MAGVVGLLIFQQITDAKDQVEAGSKELTVTPHEFALAVDENGLPLASDVNRFHRAFYLPEKAGQVLVTVVGVSSASVAVMLTEMIAKEGRDASHRRVVIRDTQSFEPVFIWLQNGKKCWIEPETSWGGVHRHTGLGASMKITDE